MRSNSWTLHSKKRETVTRDPKERHEIDSRVRGKGLSSMLDSAAHTKSSYHYLQRRPSRSESIGLFVAEQSPDSSDYGSIQFRKGLDSIQQCNTPPDLYSSQPYHDGFVDYEPIATDDSPRSDTFNDDDSLFGDAMIGLADFHSMKTDNECEANRIQRTKEGLNCANEESLVNTQQWMDINLTPFKASMNGGFANFSSPGEHCQSHEASAERLSSQLNGSASGSKVEDTRMKTVSHVLDNGLQQSAVPKTKVALDYPSKSQQTSMVKYDALALVEVPDKSAGIVSSAQKPVADTFRDLEPWLFKEFGDIVELVDE